jgi:hypothetical protein
VSIYLIRPNLHYAARGFEPIGWSYELPNGRTQQQQTPKPPWVADGWGNTIPQQHRQDVASSSVHAPVNVVNRGSEVSLFFAETSSAPVRIPFSVCVCKITSTYHVYALYFLEIERDLRFLPKGESRDRRTLIRHCADPRGCATQQSIVPWMKLYIFFLFGNIRRPTWDKSDESNFRAFKTTWNMSHRTWRYETGTCVRRSCARKKEKKNALLTRKAVLRFSLRRIRERIWRADGAAPPTKPKAIVLRAPFYATYQMNYIDDFIPTNATCIMPLSMLDYGHELEKISGSRSLIPPHVIFAMDGFLIFCPKLILKSLLL